MAALVSMASKSLAIAVARPFRHIGSSIAIVCARFAHSGRSLSTNRQFMRIPSGNRKLFCPRVICQKLALITRAFCYPVNHGNPVESCADQVLVDFGHLADFIKPAASFDGELVVACHHADGFDFGFKFGSRHRIGRFPSIGCRQLGC